MKRPGRRGYPSPADRVGARGRLPRPPRAFEGRAAELAWLEERLPESPLIVVSGAAGFGKTGLVTTALARAGRAEEATYHSAHEAPSVAGLLRAVAASLAARSGERAEPGASGSSAEDLASVVLELGERAGCTVILDDLHAADERGVERFLLTIARFATRGRFVVVTRAAPRHPDLREDAIRIGPLGHEELCRLGSRLDPALEPSAVAALAARAGGSVGRLRTLVLVGEQDLASGVLAGLSPDARRYALALSALRVPVLLPEAIASELERLGLSRALPTGHCLDDGARAALDGLVDRSEARAAALEVLDGDTSREHALEALRLTAEEGDTERAVALSSRHARQLLGAGYAPELFEALAPIGHPEIVAHRLACAERMGGGDALGWATALPPPASHAHRLIWCRLLAYAGFLDRAYAAVRGIVEEGAVGVEIEAQLVLSGLLRHLGDLDGAERLLRDLVPTSPLETIERDLRRVVLLMSRGDTEGALKLLGATPADPPDLEPAERVRLRTWRLSALLTAGRYRDLLAVLGSSDPPADRTGTDLHAHLAVAVETGAFALAERLQTRLRPAMDHAPTIRFGVQFCRARVAYAQGAWETVDELLGPLLSDAAAAGMSDLVAWGTGLRAACDVARTPGAELWPWPSGLPAAKGTSDALLRAHARVLEARSGRGAVVDEPARGGATDVEVVALRAAAEAALAAGDVARADTLAKRALWLSREHLLAIEEALVLALLLEVRMVTPRADAAVRAEAASLAEELQRAGERLGSARFAADVALAGVWITGARDALERVAAQEASPSARRRARAILGHEVALDALDRRVVAAIEPRRAGYLVLDPGRRVVELPSGREVDLGGARLFARLLETLVRGGGHASKESLVKEAWDLRDYHPHRDDKRLQVAVFRLRRLLEDDAKRPGLLLLDGDGYRIAAPVRLASSPERM